MIEVDLWYEGDQICSLLLDAVPQVGHQVVLMDMDVVGSDRKEVHWIVMEVVWGVYTKLPKDPDASMIRCIELQVVPYKGNDGA